MDHCFVFLLLLLFSKISREQKAGNSCRCTNSAFTFCSLPLLFLLIAFSSLLIAHCSLLIAHCSLLSLRLLPPPCFSQFLVLFLFKYLNQTCLEFAPEI